MTESVPVFGDAILVLDRNGPSLRHILDGQPVEDGTALDVRLAEGGWLPLRYEAR